VIFKEKINGIKEVEVRMFGDVNPRFLNLFRFPVSAAVRAKCLTQRCVSQPITVCPASSAIAVKGNENVII
jgi:hypothetical protein